MTPKDFSDSTVLVATLAQGIEEFNTHRFFECHETLEDIWRAERRPLRQFYKGVIQVAAGFHHLRRNNFKGTVNKLESGHTLPGTLPTTLPGGGRAAAHRRGPPLPLDHPGTGPASASRSSTAPASPPSPSTSARRRRRRPGLPESAYLRANGLNLHYLDWGGARPTALLLHATGFLAAVWGPIADALSRRYRVLAPDQRGHGDSDKPPSGYHRLDFVADLRAFLDALELEGIVGIGHSAGAANIACCEALRPGSFRRAVLIEPIVFPPVIQPLAGEHMTRLPRGALKRRTVWPSREALLKSYRSRPPFKTWREDVLRLYVEQGAFLRDDGQVELKCPGPIEAQMYAGATPFEAFELLPRGGLPRAGGARRAQR